MENANFTSYSNDEYKYAPDSGANIILYAVGAALAIAISVLLVVVFQMKKDYATHQANLQRVEELERRKSCPERRKRAINKLIETKRIAKGDCEEQQTSSHNKDNASIIINEDNNECPICLHMCLM